MPLYELGVIIDPEMPPEQIHYTRQVTLAWTLYFLGVALVSIGLMTFYLIAYLCLFAWVALKWRRHLSRLSAPHPPR